MLLIAGHLEAQNLAACYEFDNGMAINNITGDTGWVARCQNVPDRFGNPNKAIYAPCSSGGIINLGSRSYLKPMNGTISLWVYKPGVCRNGMSEPLIDVEWQHPTMPRSNRGSYSIGYSFDIYQARGGAMNSSYFRGGVPPTTTMPLNEWHHLVLTFDDTVNVFYQDGIESYRLDVLAPVEYTTNANVLLGWSQRSMASTDTYFDDLRIYDGALSPAQVAALYQNSAGCSIVGIPTLTDEAKSLKIIPNPNGGQFSVEQPEGLALVSYRLYDMAGRVLYSAEGLSSISTLSCEGLANGTYLLELKDETGTAYRQKLLVTK